MSAATEQVPIVVLPTYFVPGRAGHPPRSRALTVVPDRIEGSPTPDRCTAVPPRSSAPVGAVIPLPMSQPPARLTRRGVLALSTVTFAAAAALIGLAWLSAPAPPPVAIPPARVTVAPGDTLWSIASSVAPDRDPRDEVATLQHLNHLDGVSLAVGQVLRTR
jgi:Tfp pilus assembly protein FimV